MLIALAQGLGGQLAPPRSEQAQEAWVGQAGGRIPVGQLGLSQRRDGRHQLDRGIWETIGGCFGQEYAAVVRDADQAPQRKLSIDDLAFPLRP